MTIKLRVKDELVSHQVKKMKIWKNDQNENELNKSHNFQVHKNQKTNSLAVVF